MAPEEDLAFIDSELERLEKWESDLKGREAEIAAAESAVALDRARWDADRDARVRRAEADERNARASAIDESRSRCNELEARAREAYEAHISAAQARATDLEAAAMRKHDELIAAAIGEDERRRASFDAERKSRLGELEDERNRILERARAEAARIEHEAEQSRAEVQERKDELARAGAALRSDRRALDEDGLANAEQKDLLDRRQKRLDAHIAAEAAASVQPLQAELTARNARIEKLQAMLSEEARRRTELEALIAGSGGETVPRLKQQLDLALARVAELEQRHRDALSPEDADRLRQRAGNADALQRTVLELQRRLAEMEQQRGRAESERIQQEGERAIAQTLRATNQALRQELDHLKALVDQDVPNPLRAFSDASEHLRPPEGHAVEPSSLADLAQRIRYRMAALPKGRARFYDEQVVATYLAAMASTRTIILEGVSGTGKTSLPIAVAEAIGAGHEVIEVQSQWRDRGDLLGAYNPFHKRFYAQPFALALHNACLPGYRERPFFIVLDELNLSHVEHYFADLLSLLERDPSQHRLRLVDDPDALSKAPVIEGLVRDPRFGWSLEIPPNVWFVGTANRDESTRPISDKVYDRAQVIELSQRAKTFRIAANLELLDPIGYADLTSLFDRAPKPKSDELKVATDCVDSIAAEVASRFRITRTNRFEKQWESFIRVYLAAAPQHTRTRRIGEVVDHFLATKLLRPIKERFDPNLEEVLQQLRDHISTAWDDGAWGPVGGTKSLALLDDELRRRQMHGA